MQRYYFHCQVGDVVAEDCDGALLQDIRAARHDATILMAELARDELPDEGEQPTVIIRVADGRKTPVFSLQLLPEDVGTIQ